MEISTWISFADTIITAFSLGFTIYIAIIANKRFDSEKTMKGYFIEELKIIRLKEEELFQMIISDCISPNRLKLEAGALDIKISDFMSLLNEQYGFNKLYLESFQWKYIKLFSDDEEYNVNYKYDKNFKFSNDKVLQISNYRNKELYLFNRLALEINNSKKVSRKNHPNIRTLVPRYNGEYIF